MKLGRRKLLGLIGMSPLAAKAAADQAMAATTGLAPQGMQGFGHIGPPAGHPGGQVYAADASSTREKIKNWLSKNGLPEWERARLREQSRHVYALDPDIAAKKSWSMSVKIITQRQRNYERSLHEAMHHTDYQELRDKFVRETGFWLWW